MNNAKAGFSPSIRSDPVRLPVHKLQAFVAILAAAYFIALIFWNAPTAKLDFLIMASGDDLAFYQVVLRMYDAIWTLDARNFFNISFQSYGFVYFFVQLLAAAPAFALEAWDMAALILRLLPGLWGMGAVILAASIVRRHAQAPAAPVLVCLLILSTPGYWINALWNHPDLMMVFFLVAAFWWASRNDDPLQTKNLVIVCALYALSLGSKFQALIAAPALALYLFWPCLVATGVPAAARFRSVIRPALLCTGMTLGFFVLFNPYLLHPLGLWSFFDDLWKNIDSNRTNHGDFTVPSLAEKISVIGIYYFHLIAASCFAAACCISLGLRARRRDLPLRPIASFITLALITATIMIGANKAWGHYYVGGFVFLCMAAGIMLPSPGRHGRWGYAIAIFLLIVASATSAYRIQTIASDRFYAALDPVSIRQRAEALAASMAALVGPDATIAVSPRTPISFRTLGIRPDRIRVIDGALRPESLGRVSHLVIAKTDVYFNDALYADIARRALPHRASMESARSLVMAILAGQHPDFRKCAETRSAYIFCKSTKIKP